MLAAMAVAAFGQDNLDLKALNKLQKEQVAAKSAFKRHPKDATAKQKYVAATVKLGTADMSSDALDRKVKYKKALQLYREALKVDPNNVEAKNNKQLIESIYKSMGRPVPQ